jgi:hypothetical protein
LVDRNAQDGEVRASRDLRGIGRTRIGQTSTL